MADAAQLFSASVRLDEASAAWAVVNVKRPRHSRAKKAVRKILTGVSKATLF
jgi:hypothetical protein